MALLFTTLNLSSCTKTNTNTVTVHDTTVVTDTVIPAPTILSLLTGKQWELDTVYWSYTGPGTGTLVYTRGGSNNVEDLDAYYTTYTAQGDFWCVENGTYYTAQWIFLNSDSASYKEVSPGFGTVYARILALGATNLKVYDSTNSALDIEILAP